VHRKRGITTFLQSFDARDLLSHYIPQQLAWTIRTTGRYNSYPEYANFSNAVGKDVYFGSVYNGWTSGFFPGELWAMYEYSNDTQSINWLTAAQEWTAGIAPEQYDNSTHDVGFMVFYSFGHGYLLTGNPDYKTVLLNAAQSLSTRYNSIVGCIRSWPGYHFPVIIDNMMNLELLFWASQNGGSKEWFDMAVSHADKTAENHIRPAGNSWHLVDYDPTNGSVISVCNCPQGLAQTNATWARGQAWAIYGFTIAYRYSNLTRFLAMAQKVSDWFIANVPSDYVPLWDFAAMDGIKDSSAASIAACGLIELSSYLSTTNSTASKAYLTTAYNILGSLSSSVYLADPTKSEALLLHGTGGQGSLMDYSLIYGDYYFIEALLKTLKL
jgi:unsaturated chondroitin disaccharide hydrolase